MKMMKLLPLLGLIHLIHFVQSFEFASLTVTSTNKVINTLADYTIVYDRTYNNDGSTAYNTEPITTTDTVTVTFPTQYSLTAITCLISIDGGPDFTPSSCTISGNKISAGGVFSANTFVATVTLRVFNILNPSPAVTTGFFIGTIGSDTSGSGQFLSSISLEPAEFSSCYATFSPTTVNSTGNMVIRITPKNSIGTAGSIQVVFPAARRWSNDISTTQYFPIATSMACSSQSSNVKSAIACLGDINAVSVTASNLFSTANIEEFSFSINSFLSPPSNQPVDQLVITSYISGNKLDSCTLYVSDLSPKQITSSSISSSTGASIIVNAFYTIKFSIVLTETMTQTDTITVQLPSTSTLSFSSTTINSNIAVSRTLSTYDENTLTLYFVMDNQSRTFFKGSTIWFQVGSYKAPPSIEPTSPFTLTIYKNGYQKMAGTTTLTASASTLTGTVSVTNSAVNALTSYALTVILNDPITASGKIKIIFPPSISISGVTLPNCANVVGNNVKALPTCTVNSTEHSITLTSLNSSTNNIGAQTLSITIANLKNPSSTAPTSTFSISTYYLSTDSSMVATGTLQGITPTTATIDSSKVTVTPSSSQVNDISVDYQVSVTVTHPIPIGGYFTVYVPEEVQVDLAAIASSCSLNINSTSFLSTSCGAVTQGSGVLITFTNPFSAEASTSTIFIAKIKSIFTNPISTKPTSSFQIHTYHSNGYSIAQVTSAVNVQMDTADSFMTTSVTRDSAKNYELTTYRIKFTQSSPLEPSSIVIITLPNDLAPSLTSQCAMLLPIPTSALVCTLETLTFTIVLPASAITPSTPIELSISEIRNPPSFAPSTSFTLQTKTSNNNYRYSYGIFSPALANTVSTPFEALTYSFVPRILGETTVLKINFNPSDSTKVPSSLRLSFADSFTINNPSCNSFVDFFNASCSVIATNTIEVVGIFGASLMSFSVTGITVPNVAPTDYSSLISFDQGGYKLDESTSTILFELSCTLPCRTCQTTLSTSCLSCYSNTAISTFIYYDSSLKTCNEQCVDGKFQNTATLKCTLCNSNCLTCQNSPTYCLTCKPNSTSTFNFLYIQTPNITQTCVSQCPTAMYPDRTIEPTTCVDCVSPCQTCSDVTFCLSCINGTYFYLNQCLPDCPNGIAIENSLTNQCDLCDDNCLTCATTTTTCTSCNSSLLLYLGQCLSDCPLPLVPKNGTCGPCDQACKTCVDDPFTCTSCNSGEYLHLSSCLALCPELYYENIGSGVCSLCSTVSNLHCANCSTVSTCLSCDDGYVLHNSACLAITPEGYVNISGVAVVCAGECATCSISTNNCTSCRTFNLLNNQCLENCPASYIALNKTCQPCISPCKTCETDQYTCTSCLTTLTPDVYLNGNDCDVTCPDGTFPNSATNICRDCISPCEYCTSLTSCTTCLTGFFLEDSTRCVETCQSGWTGVGRTCQQCVGNCATCQNETSLCTSCDPDTYLFTLNNSCLTDCGEGLFINSLTKTCVYCEGPCKTCTNTSDTCLSCLTGVLHENQCSDSCPDKYFNQSSKCQPCPTNCSSCLSLTTCTGCIDSFVLYNGFCITSCPRTHSIIINSICTLCTDSHCHTCDSADVCDSCESDYSLLNGNCLGTCPAGFETNGTHCIDTNEVILTTSSAFPVPFCIASAVIIVACLMSKLQFNHTFMPGAVFAFLGIFEWGALAYFLYLYFLKLFESQPLPLLVGLGSLAYLYLLNILALVIQNVVFCSDKHFRNWYVGSNKCFTIFTNFISLLTSHKFRNILFSKLFTFAIFTAQLDSVNKFKVLNVFSFLTLIHSAAAIFAAAVALPNTEISTQLYYECIDVIVVTSINALIGFFTVSKSKDFFYERTPDGFDLKKKIKADDDYFEDKIEPAGKDVEDEQGYYSNITHVASRGFATTQPFKFPSNQINEQISSDQDYSYGSLIGEEKKYEEISVQALELINEDEKGGEKTFDITGIDQNQIQGNSNFTVIFNQSDKGIQNTIDHGPSLTEKSIQPSLANKAYVDQSMQKYNTIDAVDRSAQHTVFYNNDQSMQYAESMKTKPPSVHNRSIQNAPSVSSKNIMYKPDVMNQSNQKSSIERVEEGVQNSTIDRVEKVDYSVQRSISRNDEGVQKSTIDKKSEGVQNVIDVEDHSLQAVHDTSEKANQRTLKMSERSAQMTQKSYRDESVQKAPTQKDESIQFENQVKFDEMSEERASHEGVIFQQDENEENHEAVTSQLIEHSRDQLILPKHQMASYQEELEQRIREKESELSMIKRKIESKERTNSLKKEKLQKADFRVEVGKLYNKGDRNSSQDSIDSDFKSQSLERGGRAALKKESKQVAEQPDQIEKTIEEIQVLDDDGKKVRVQFENREDLSKRSEEEDEQLMGMLEMHENQILYEDSDDKDQPEHHIMDDQIRQEAEGDSRFKKVIGRREENVAGEISDGKDNNSTKLYSSIHPMTRKNKNKLGVEQVDIDKSLDDNSQEIEDHPIHPTRRHNVQSDMSETIQELHPNPNLNLNKTAGSFKNKPTSNKVRDTLRDQLPNTHRNRNEIPPEKIDEYPSYRFDKPRIPLNEPRIPADNARSKGGPEFKRSETQANKQHQRRSSLLIAGKSQLADQRLVRKSIPKGSPLKTAKKWEYENEDKNISESGEEEIPNTRAKNPQLIIPFETDKEETQFRQNEIRHSEAVIANRSHKIMPSPQKKQKYNRGESNPLIMQMEHSNQIPVKPKFQLDFGTDQFSGEASHEPYIEEDGDSDYASRYKNNMILGQMLQRPGNEEIRRYYEQQGGRRSGSKSKKGNGKTSTEKIYKQRLNK